MAKNEKTEKTEKTEKAVEPVPAVAGPVESADAVAGADASDDSTLDASQKAWAEQLKKVAYAAAGVVNVSTDDVKAFVSKLVEKGELAQKDGRKIVKDLADRVKKTVKEPAQAAKEARDAAMEFSQPLAESGEKLAERVNGSIQRVLHTMNIATRQDVVDLGRQIDELDKKLCQLLETATGAKPVGVAS